MGNEEKDLHTVEIRLERIDSLATQKTIPSGLHRFRNKFFKKRDRFKSLLGASSNGEIPSDSNTFNVYQMSLKLNPFKWATWLLTLTSLSILLIEICFHSIRSYSTRVVDRHKAADVEQLLHHKSLQGAIETYDRWPPVVISSTCLVQLMLLSYVIFKLKKDGQKSELAKLQIISLTCSSIWASILSIQDLQLVSIQPVTMFIVYTLLAVDNQRAFLATSTANLLHLLGFTIIYFTCQSYIEDLYINYSRKILLLSLIYLIFHVVGWYLNKCSRHSSKKSFNDIKSYVSAKILMDNEDKRLTKLMESVIPKHLAGRMREDILLPQNKGNFNNIYLDFYDEVSILFADIVNFTKISSACSAQLLVETLNELFGRFDQAADRNHCLRIKILGDCYYCVTGIPDMSDEHAIRSVEMGLDMIDILGDLAQDNSGVDLNMRVGIHSGRALCGVLGKKKWQFDVHSNDVKLANHMEQSGIPGRVHITEDTLKALDGRYEVEPSHGHLRDTYIAQRNISTYFVIAPTNRQASLERCKLFGPRSTTFGSRSNSVACETSVLTKGSKSNFGLESASQQQDDKSDGRTSAMTLVDSEAPGVVGRLSVCSSSSQNQIQDLPSAGKSSIASLAPRQPQQQAAAKLRFRLATQRIINALHFIRTIDPPFANLDTPTTNVERMIQDTIVSRYQAQDIHRFSLRFKDQTIGRLYGSLARIRILKSLLIYISILCCVLFLVTQTVNLPNVSITGRVNCFDGSYNESNHSIVHEKQQPRSLVHDIKENIRKDGHINQTHKLMMNEKDDDYDHQRWNQIDMKRSIALMGAILVAFLLTLIVYIHQSELNSRRDFLWRQIAIEDKDRMARMRDCNRFIFFNLLPPHVASYFLEQRVARSHMDLYYKSYERIGVVFASISNFSDFYSEVQGNNHGLECLRVLNEIICDFDSILDDERFKAVDKIKTIGSTYMAAIGLFPHSELPSDSIESPQAESDQNLVNSELEPSLNDHKEAAHLEARRKVARYLQILVRFVQEMKLRLQDINEHSFNCFKLRVGINVGPVTAGVIGASKPQYDIWGNTVNVASRMESTAEPNKIQITKEVYDILNDFNDEYKFKFSCRGSINVKGKGFMTTYYLNESS